MKQEKILIVEDDPNIANLLEIHITDLGYRLDRATDGVSGLEKAISNSYSLIILDLMLPRMDGLEICRRIRAEKNSTPILMLTARSVEMDRVLGLELGADDYITKPFSIREVIARIKSIFRRIEAEKEKHLETETQNFFDFGELTVDLEKHRVVVRGEAVELTAKEFDLLTLFAQNPGRIYDRQALLDMVWGYQYSGYDHTVNSHINRLRNKIERDPANPQFIRTLWGVGYKFIEPENHPA